MDDIRTALVMFRYQLQLSLREPAWIIITLIHPLLYLALFGPLVGAAADAKGFPRGDAWQVFVPGVLVQLGMFGSLFVGFGIVGDLRNGSVERMRVTPASRLGLLLGRILRDAFVLVLQGTLLTLIAVAFGLRVPAVGALIAVAIVGLLGVALSSISYAAGLRFKSESALAPFLNMVALPTMLLSGILLPMTLAPRWLRLLSQANPLSHVVDAARAAFRGDYDDMGLAVGLGCAATLAVVGLWIAERTFRRASS